MSASDIGSRAKVQHGGQDDRRTGAVAVKILVTGSAGFIGFHVARRLMADGHLVAGLDAMTPYYDVRLKERRHAVLGGSNAFRAHRVDLCDMAALDRAFHAEEPDIVIHLAAQAGVRYSLEAPRTYVETNVVGTFNLLELCRARMQSDRPLAHFMLASTSSVYGANERMPFRESARTAFPLTIYAATKLAAEEMTHSSAHLWNLPATVFRFFTVYGPWGRPDMALFRFVAAIEKGEPIEVYNHGRMARDFTYIDDLVEGIVRLVPLVPQRGGKAVANDEVSPQAPFRTVNIGAGAPVDLESFIAAVERALCRKAARRDLPMQPGEVEKTWADCSLLESLTGFRPSTPVEKGVAAFVEWYRTEYEDLRKEGARHAG